MQELIIRVSYKDLRVEIFSDFTNLPSLFCNILFYRLTPVSKPVNKRLVKYLYLLLPLSPWVTLIHVALFWAKFLLVKHARPPPPPTSPQPPWPPTPPPSPQTPDPHPQWVWPLMGHTFSCRTFLSKISTIQTCTSTPSTHLTPTPLTTHFTLKSATPKNVTPNGSHFFMSHFFEHDLVYLNLTMSCLSVNP